MVLVNFVIKSVAHLNLSCRLSMQARPLKYPGMKYSLSYQTLKNKFNVRWLFIQYPLYSKGQKRHRNVASSNTFCLEAHAGFFRLLKKRILDPYVQWPFNKKLNSWFVTRVRTCDYTVLFEQTPLNCSLWTKLLAVKEAWATNDVLQKD